ncbi:MAG: purine-cytosine permease family protein [Candidatus Tyrphobacter sp.]
MTPPAPEPIYKDQVLKVEPTGIERVSDAQRHGRPWHLFGVWFSANAEIATWMVGLTIAAFYGTNLRGAAIGIAIGNVVGFAILGFLAGMGPRYGVPQMVAGRLAFGRSGNVAPAALSFLAGVGWFAINTVFGAYALQTLAGLPYAIALGVMLALQVILAVYGYNLIHLFERASVVLLALGFLALGVVTFEHARWNLPFNAHAPSAGGGAIGGFIFATALTFSYALGWVPCASDYSRYLPAATNPRAIWWYSFAGCALPCIALEIMGAAVVTAAHGVDFTTALPTQAVSALLGTGWVAKVVLVAVVLGTLTANCMNLYSGSLAALVAFDVRVKRAVAALAVGVIGAVLATRGGNPAQTAGAYTNFLLLLSYWASPWAGVVLVDWWMRGDGDPQRASRWRAGLAAWLVGLALSAPFWNQAWFVGPVARAFPQLGDLSYYVGFSVAAIAMALLSLRFRTRTPAIE